MDYKTEVIRTATSLTIRWRNEADGRWAVTKKFNLGTRILEDAEIEFTARKRGPAADLAEAKQAQELAHDLDAAFQCPEDFDRVKIADQEPESGMPAQVVGIVLGGPIYIAIAPRGAQ